MLNNFTFFKKQDDAFDNGCNNNFFFSRDITGKGNKKYGSCETDEQFLLIYNKINTNDKKNFYEILRTNNPRFEYYDIEFIKDNFDIPYTMLGPENFFNYFLSIRNSILRSFDIDPERYKTEWYVSDSSKMKDEGFKVSYHIVNRKMIFKNNEETLSWLEGIKKYIKKHPDEKLGNIGKSNNVPDLTVYSSNRCMRLLDSSKFGEIRPLKRAEWHPQSRNAQFHKFLITNVKETDLTNPTNLVFGDIPEISEQVKETKNIKEQKREEAKLRRANNSDSSDSLFYNMFDALNDERFEGYSNCLRAIWIANKIGLTNQQIHQLSSKATNYDEDWTEKTINDYSDEKCTLTEATLHEWLMQDNKDKYDELVPKEKRLKNKIIPLETISNPDEVIDLNNIGSYIPRFEKKNCIAIRSNMMTFKTQNMKELFDDQNKSILIVSFRKSLDEAYLNTFEEYGFELYCNLEKTQGKIIAKRLVVQIDSLHLVQGAFDYLICDEIVSTIKHLIDFVREKSYVFESLKNYIRNCNRVLVCDALLNDSIITFFKRLRNEEVHVIDNQYKSFTNRSYQIMESANPAFVIMDIIDCLVRGLKVIVPTNSKKFSDKLYARLTADPNEFKVGLITVDTDTIPVERWTEYDIIIYTPKFVAGNSFNEIHFDKLIAYASNRSCDANYFSQMLFRNRNLKPQSNGEIFRMKIYIKETQAFLPVLSKDLHKFIKRQDDPVYKTGLTIDNYNQRIIKNDYYDLYSNCLKIKHQSINNFSGMLRGILNHHGLTEIEGDPSGIDINESRTGLFDSIEQKDDEKRFQNACFEQFNFDIADEICDATDIDSSIYESLKRKFDLTIEERRKVQKFIFQSTFNHPVLTPELFMKLNDSRNQFKNAEELYQNKDNVENHIQNCIQTYGQAKPNLETIDRLTSNHIVSKYCKLFHIFKMYKAIGLEGPFDTKTIKGIPYQDIKQFIIDNFKKIETSFGSAVNKKKMKEFQDLDISIPKNKSKLVHYINSKIVQMIGNGGKLDRINKNKGTETYGIKGIKEYYEELGVQFYESKSVRFLKQEKENNWDEIDWDEVEEVELVFED